MFTIHLAKDTFKFSCSHFTIFSPTHAERLHGHNYQLRVDITLEALDNQLGMAFDFNSVKPLIRQFCTELDERILLPGRSPYLQLTRIKSEIEVRFGAKRYLFPEEDTLTLPLVNVTSEELARYGWERLHEQMKSLPAWKALRVDIEETRGQGVSFTRAR